ncbi:MAG: CoA transferase [Anaerolineales bacterium]|nr:CoA transferase [Anaerolineales bacterium]
MKALEGLRLLELTHMVSGPYAGLILADLGVEVIKVETPGKGDMTRPLMVEDPRYNVQDMGPYFMSLNRSKKSITLNLKNDRGLGLFYELVKISDIVLNNFSVGVLERLKIDHARLAALNPGIITCSITGFGETGPEKDLPAYDMVAQAMSGVMSITGPPGGPPTRAGYPIADINASMMAVTGILAALHARSVSGRGQHVDISMLDVQISALNYMAAISLMSGEAPGQLGNQHHYHVPYDVYPCRDGHIILAVVTDEFWQNLVRIEELAALDIPENRVRVDRLKNRDQIGQSLADIFRTRDKSYWLEKLREARIPCASVNDLTEVFQEPQVQARNMIIELDYGQDIRVRLPGNPVKLSDTHEDSFAPSPVLGQHNREILGGWLGASEGELGDLQKAGVI